MAILATTGNVQVSGGSPSNEQVTLAMVLVVPQAKFCVPGIALVTQSNANAANERESGLSVKCQRKGSSLLRGGTGGTGCRKRSSRLTCYVLESGAGLRGGMSWKLRVMSAVCPNSSVTVSTTVWLSVPNLSILTTRGRTQSSGAPPSNEHVTDTTLLVKSQSNLCLPGTPEVPHTPSRTVRRMVRVDHRWTGIIYLEVLGAPELQFVSENVAY